MAVNADALCHVHAAFDDLDARRLQQRLSLDRRRTGRSDACAGDARHPLSAARSGRPVDGGDRCRHAVRASARVFHDEAAVEMRRITLSDIGTEAKLLLIGIPVLIWTL